MKKTYGKIIKNLVIDEKPAPYPVVNERGIRAAAGIMFAIGISTLFTVVYTKNYQLMNIVVSIFWLDFFFKTVFQPKYSIFGFLGELFVKKQKPEYVGAIQKRFAWGLGLIMATIMIIVAILLEMRGIIPLVICSTCLLFMWMETALGICVGCKIYGFLLKKKIIKTPKFRPACPGGVCKLK